MNTWQKLVLLADVAVLGFIAVMLAFTTLGVVSLERQFLLHLEQHSNQYSDQ